MKTIIASCLVVLFGVTGAAASGAEDSTTLHDVLTERRVYRCQDYAYNATLIIPRLHKEGKVDSVHAILDFWEEECGTSSRILRTRIMLAIEAGTFDESLYDFEIIDHMLFYRWVRLRVMERGTVPYVVRTDPGDSDPDLDFDDWFIYLARTQAARWDSTSLEFLLADFYGGHFDTSFRRLKTVDFLNTDLREYYDNYVEDIVEDPPQATSYRLLTGVWMPTGKLGVVGDHPSIGFAWGANWPRTALELVFAVRFLDADTVYRVNVDGRLDSTDHFYSLYAGGEVAQTMAEYRRFRIDATGGLGWSGIYTVDKDDDDDAKKHILNSFNLNAGLRTRLFLDKYKSWSIGLYGKYNLISFDTDGGTDFSGNAVSIGFSVGYTDRGGYKRTLKALNAFD